MEIEYFLGKTYEFSGYNTTTIDMGDEKVNGVVFRLDNICYMAVENFEDRDMTYLSDFIVVPDYFLGSNTFPPTMVKAKHRSTHITPQSKDILVLEDVVTGLTVLEVGTGDADTYDSYFYYNYDPTGMSHNVDLPHLMEVCSELSEQLGIIRDGFSNNQLEVMKEGDSALCDAYQIVIDTLNGKINMYKARYDILARKQEEK